MSKLNIDQKSVKALFSEKKADFLIPDYQRPYAWGEKECQTLWDDLFLFAFPDNDCDKFKSDSDEYFLGPIVTFKNDDGKLEIIDGQQRLTTLMLLLRAFYEKYGSMKNDKAVKTSKFIEQCIWKTDEFGDPDKSALKIDSEVATDKEKGEFLNILKTGKVSENEKSSYANNYRFFQQKIVDFLNTYPDWFSFFPIRIMNNCILLPIEAESQDTALRIFSTLNDRGKPLSDADIFKAQFYKYYSAKGEREVFIQKWKDLEVLCDSIFHPLTGTPMDELFTRYMYYERAKQGIKSSTTEALRKFYERNAYLDRQCSEIDALLSKNLSSIEDYKKLKQAVITQAVTKGVRGEREMKDSGVEWIGEIPKEWGRTKIKMIASFFNGDRTSRYPQPTDFVDDGIAFLTSRNIDGDEVNLSETKYITESKYNSLSGAKIQIDDIIFCLRGSVGKCAINQTLSCGTVASSLATIRPKDIHPKYLLYSLLSNVASIQTTVFMNGTCAANLSAENVANYYITLPSSTEQKEIADYLDAKCAEIDGLIAKKEQLVKELESYKKSLIYEVVTGKREV